MNRTVTATIRGEKRELLYSIGVLFKATEKYGNIQKVFDILATDTEESFETVRWFAVEMANEAELCRRDEGFEPLSMLQEETISLRMQPLEYNAIRSAVVQAIAIGYRRDIVDEDEEVDLGLQELNAKKAPAGN